MYLFNKLLKSVFGLRNLKTLGYRFVAVVGVIYHYWMVEKIEYDNWVHNEWELISFILLWHFVTMNFKVLQENKRKKEESQDLLQLSALICLVFGVFTLLTLLLSPIFAWFGAQITLINLSYFKSRYIYLGLYIVLNIVNAIFPLVRNFMFFVTDGLILSQLTSLYLFNEYSMSALLTVLPVLFVI